MPKRIKKPGDKGYIPLRYRGEDTNPYTGEALAAAFSAGRRKKPSRKKAKSHTRGSSGSNRNMFLEDVNLAKH